MNNRTIVRAISLLVTIFVCNNIAFAGDTATVARSAENDRIIGMLNATSMLFRRDYAGAINIYNKLLQSNPHDAEIITRRGWALLESGKQKEGRAEVIRGIIIYDREISSQPDNGRLYYQRGSAYRWIRDYSKAMTDIEKAIKLSPERTNYPMDLKMIKLQQQLQ